MRGLRSAIVNIEPQKISEVSNLALGDPDIIPLWFGESDLVTPDFIRDAAKRALDEGKTFYDHAGGTKALRASLVDYMQRIYGVAIAPERVLVPGSAMLGIAMAVGMLVEPGTNLIVVSPCWPNVALAIESRGAEARHVRLDEVAGTFSLDLNKIEAAIDGQTRGVFVASPGNPTGWVMTAEQQRALLEITRRHGIGLIADEVYTRIVYEGIAAPSFLEIATDDDLVFVVNTFSKAWAMTGWRIGWMVTPKPIHAQMQTMAMIENTGATVFAQYGALAALEQGEPFVAQMIAKCRAGLELVEQRLSQHPRIKWMRPQGAFYAYFGVDGMTDSLAFAQDLVRRARVGLAPGSAFGPGNDGFLRLCFAQSPARLEIALDRLTNALNA
jgi:aspartate/methionine/tyrosine aminotransferase